MMKAMMQNIVRSKILSAVFAASFAIVSAATLWAYAATKNISGPIVLHYNNIDRITERGTAVDFVLIGVTGAVMAVVNLFLALELERRDPFLGKLVAAATLFLSILIFIAFAAIISVN